MSIELKEAIIELRAKRKEMSNFYEENEQLFMENNVSMIVGLTEPDPDDKDSGQSSAHLIGRGRDIGHNVSAILNNLRSNGPRLMQTVMMDHMITGMSDMMKSICGEESEKKEPEDIKKEDGI